MLIYLLIAIALRLSGLFTAGIWYDESISRYRALHPTVIQQSISDTGGVYWDAMLIPFSHGPLWLLRLPAFILSCIALALAWRLMHDLNFNKGQRVIACIAMATLPGLIWISQDARVYAALSAVYLSGLLFAIENKPLGLAAAVGLLGYLHPTGIFLAAGAMAVSLLYMPLKRSMAAGLAVVAWIPAFIPFVTNSTGSAFWLEKIDILSSFGYAAFVNTIWPWAGGIVIVMVIIMGAVRRQALPLTMAIAIPIVLLLLAGLFVGPMLFYRPIMPLLIPICLLAAIGLYTDRITIIRLLPAGLAAAVLILSLVNWDPSNRGGNIDEYAAMIKRAYQPGDRIIYVTGTVGLPFDYYLNMPSCILEWGNFNLTPYYLDYPKCDNLNDPGRYWYIYPNDPLVQTAKPKGVYYGSVYKGWQFAPIDIILVTK